MRLGRVLASISIAVLLAACGSTPPKASNHHTRPPSPTATTQPSTTGQGTAAAPSGVTGTSTGTGTTASQTLPRQTPQLPPAHTVVNGCDPTAVNPPGPFGMCLTSLPHFYCCSEAAVAWSGVVAGMDVDVKGAVPIDPATGKPQSAAVLFLGPDSWRAEIPVAANGAFAQQVTFPAAGAYQIGVMYDGAPANLENFMVGWRYKVLSGPTLGDIFPVESGYWGSDDLMLMAEVGTPQTWTIELDDAQGAPQPGATFGTQGSPSGSAPMYGWTADAQGRITYTFPGADRIVSPNGIAPGLYVQTYADIRPQGAALAGFPGGGSSATASQPTSAPFSVTQDGITYYNLEDFLYDSTMSQFTGPGVPSAYNLDRKTGVLSLYNAGSGLEARVLFASGTVQSARVRGDPPTTTWTTVGTVRLVMTGDQAYLSMPDLITAVSALAFAAPDGKGGMYFSFPWIP